MESTQLAKEILKQIYNLAPRPVIWSWGASAHKIVSANQIKGVNEDYLGGLLMYVRGMLHKGHVLITLAGNDTYTVTTGHVRKGSISIRYQVKDVYFYELGDTIDQLIERIPEYKK
jgi:hypothetical protein